MAMKCAVVMMAVVAAAMVVNSESAPSPVDCTTVVMGMSDCLSYVTNGSKVDKPEGSCCSGLKSVLKTNAECLCEGFKSSSQFGVVLNVTKALALPDACHVHAPSAAKCGLSLSPADAPSQAPAAGGAAGGAAVSPAGSPSASSTANAPSMGIGGSEMSPAMSPGASSSNAVVIPVQLIVAGLAAAFFSSF